MLAARQWRGARQRSQPSAWQAPADAFIRTSVAGSSALVAQNDMRGRAQSGPGDVVEIERLHLATDAMDDARLRWPRAAQFR